MLFTTTWTIVIKTQASLCRKQTQHTERIHRELVLHVRKENDDDDDDDNNNESDRYCVSWNLARLCVSLSRSLESFIDVNRRKSQTKHSKHSRTRHTPLQHNCEWWLSICVVFAVNCMVCALYLFILFRIWSTASIETH